MTEEGSASEMARKNLMRRVAGEIILSASPGATMRKWRNLFEISQTELANNLGFAPSVLSDYEKGRRKSPGTIFIKKFVTALLALDEERGGTHIRRHVFTSKRLSGAILDLAEFPRGMRINEVVEAVDGRLLTRKKARGLPVYGYTIINSIQAIKIMSGEEFLQLFGSNSMRALVFTDVTRGRSPMIAVRIYPIKPRMVVVHGPEKESDVDGLAIDLAEADHIPLVLSLSPTIDKAIQSLRGLARR